MTTLTPSDKASIITDLHAHLCAKTAMDLILNDQRRRMWWDWCSYSAWTWTKDDLGRVVSYLISQIKIDKRNEGSLKFTNLIGQPDKFEEDLGLAKKAAKPNPMFAAKPKAQPGGAGMVNSQGEAAFTGKEAAQAWGAAFSNPPRQDT